MHKTGGVILAPETAGSFSVWGRATGDSLTCKRYFAIVVILVLIFPIYLQHQIFHAKIFIEVSNHHNYSPCLVPIESRCLANWYRKSRDDSFTLTPTNSKWAITMLVIKA